ncbi:hypothetical protein SAMN03080615_01635 [Amphritea atlantica]|uniref:Uncharacterized protein n=1 Tax=Amphritea atlantica TaxID=355243 RepID=A0A1H9GF90_9GAMM|nr:hypothetical protein [Amphritea atlantica]SEQ48488.1 hypothetical protein SAMN03080615_01635 [Amphritea atlantica]
MTIRIANNALENCFSIDQVVELINDEMSTDATAEMVATAYAMNAAKDAGYGYDEDSLSAHLDCLVESGAEFDYQEALSSAIAESSILND